MKKELNNLITNQINQKKKLLNEKNLYLAIIYRDILQHKEIRQIHKDLMKAEEKPNRRLLQYNLYLAKRLKKLDNGPGKYYEGIGLAGLAIALITYLSVYKINNNEHKIINRELRESEANDKNKILNDSLELTERDKKIFFVASSHDDCAKDHQEAQGKVYVDQNWRKIIGNDEKVANYINSHNIDSVQYIINNPVYFITRPNCRHYFVRYSADDILSGNYRVPHHHIGPRGSLQSNRKISLDYYEDRLKLYDKLYKIYKTDELQAKITKTKILVKKWKK
jgi:hypothetical protein